MHPLRVEHKLQRRNTPSSRPSSKPSILTTYMLKSCPQPANHVQKVGCTPLPSALLSHCAPDGPSLWETTGELASTMPMQGAALRAVVSTRRPYLPPQGIPPHPASPRAATAEPEGDGEAHGASSEKRTMRGRTIDAPTMRH